MRHRPDGQLDPGDTLPVQRAAGAGAGDARRSPAAGRARDRTERPVPDAAARPNRRPYRSAAGGLVPDARHAVCAHVRGPVPGDPARPLPAVPAGVRGAARAEPAVAGEALLGAEPAVCGERWRWRPSAPSVKHRRAANGRRGRNGQRRDERRRRRLERAAGHTARLHGAGRPEVAGLARLVRLRLGRRPGDGRQLERNVDRVLHAGGPGRGRFAQLQLDGGGVHTGGVRSEDGRLPGARRDRAEPYHARRGRW